jgi:hypothetical protein
MTSPSVRKIWRSVLLSAVVASTMATSCFRRSTVVLTPSPTSPRRMQARVIAITDSIARIHGLKPKRPWDYCTVRGIKGIPDAAWQGGSLWLSTCVDTEHGAMEIELRRNGYRWQEKDKIIRQELSDALGAALKGDSISVVIDPE